jgi:cell wall-associated NlpC family hydrolase
MPSALVAALVTPIREVQSLVGPGWSSDPAGDPATALEPYLESPAAKKELLAEAQRSLAEAIAVVDDLRAQLDGHAATLTAPAASALPAARTPAGFGSPSLPLMGSGFGGGAPMSPSPGAGGNLGSDLGDLAKFAPPAEAPLPDATAFGDGFAVRLPDGSTAMAPNAVAASAVRHALPQLGVPYRWGGTTPGVGLDCSGLTQWAYHEAGLDLPRLAQEQDIGAAVNAGSVRPGDLAVWDGHVAMIVGNRTMIEAGDPVHLSPIRTTNAGQGFQGFWRPTA